MWVWIPNKRHKYWCSTLFILLRFCLKKEKTICCIQIGKICFGNHCFVEFKICLVEICQFKILFFVQQSWNQPFFYHKTKLNRFKIRSPKKIISFWTFGIRPIETPTLLKYPNCIFFHESSFLTNNLKNWFSFTQLAIKIIQQKFDGRTLKQKKTEACFAEKALEIRSQVNTLIMLV